MKRKLKRKFEKILFTGLVSVLVVSIFGCLDSTTGTEDVKTINAASPVQAVSLDGGSLGNGTTVTSTVAAGSWRNYTISVASGESLSIKMTGNGDADLYVQKGSRPTTSSYDFCPYYEGSNESVLVNSSSSPVLSDGTWYISVYGYSTSTFELTAALTKNSSTNPDPDPDPEPDPDPAPSDAYSDVENLYGSALISGLYAKVKSHTNLGYDTARLHMFTSIDPVNGKVYCVYSGRSMPTPSGSYEAYSSYSFNTEHSWPRGQFNKSEPANSDLHHLFPTDVTANGRRDSWDFGITANPSYTFGDSELGPDSGGSTVFEVQADKRGDIARAHFYMAVRYSSGSLTIDDNSSSSDGRINSSEEALLRQWHLSDPVDSIERARNDSIEAVQGNRNPFVDRPEFIDQISDF
ncbi:MAG: hypothetical protein GY754_17285 [bacterium]|nr:hypothetical protein [bacterium]